MPADVSAGGAGRPIRRVRVRVVVPDVLRPLEFWLDAERERWVLWVPVAIGLGIAAFFAVRFEPGVGHGAAVLAVALVLAAVAGTGTLRVFVVATLAWGGAGFFAATVRSSLAAAPILERPLANVALEGLVERVEERPGRAGARLTLRVTRLGDLGRERMPARVRVRAKGAQSLVPGDAIRLIATLSPPAPPVLPGDYDFGRAAWFQRIGAVGYALSAPERIEPPADVPVSLRFFAAIERVRQAITQRITAALPGEQGAIAAAMITGERGGITDETTAAYRASGIYHILSISGLHMVVMAGSVFWAVRFALAAWPALALRWPIKKWAAVAAAIAALGYLLISGAAPATQRSFLMISVGFAAILADRPAIALRTVALSAIALLVVWPESLLDIGFQMSYAAVVAMVSAFEVIRVWRGEPDGDVGVVRRAMIGFGAIVLTTLIAGVAVWPFAAYYFHTSQQYAVLGNVLAIPVCNIVVMPAALATLLLMPFGLEGAALWVMALGIDLMTGVAKWVAALPGTSVAVRAIPDATFHAVVAGGLWLTLWSTRGRFLGLVAIIVGLAFTPFNTPGDIIVGRDGRLVAVRGQDGRLSALSARGTTFELRRVLEHDGDDRAVQTVLAASVFICDPLGCIGEVKGLRLAVVRHPAALADDCGSAHVVVIDTPEPRGCKPRLLLLDRTRLSTEGTHVLSIATDGRVLIRTVEADRGRRAWTRSARPTLSSRSAARSAALSGRPASRLAAFSPVAMHGDSDAADPERFDLDVESDNLSSGG